MLDQGFILGKKTIKVFKFQELVAQNVFFKYSKEEKYVISNLYIKIKRGERIGIIGETGSGKTTLIDLLIGLLDPTDGNIKING